MSDSDYALRWAKKIRAINLLGGKCNRCGESDILTLDFHHPSKKNFLIGISVNFYSWEDIEKEVLKCELLCANCHMEHHHPIGDGRSAVMKRKVLEMLGNPVCCFCGKTRENAASLDFHHIKGNKEFNASDVFARKHSVGLQELFEEISKCKIICRNCHCKTKIKIDKFNRLSDSIKYKMEHHNSKQKIDIEAILEMDRNGSRGVDIVRKLGYHKSTVSMILKRERAKEKGS
jgi:hypothetical protein